MMTLNSTTSNARFHLTVSPSGGETIGRDLDHAPGYYPPTEGSSDAPFVVVDVRSDDEPTGPRIRAMYGATFGEPCPV